MMTGKPYLRKRVWIVICLLVVGGLGWGAKAIFEKRQYENSLAQARDYISRKNYASALPLLADLAVRWPGDAEAECLLGDCATATGDLEQACAAWERVPRWTIFSDRAVLSSARARESRGEFAIAERHYDRLLATLPAGPDRRRGVEAKASLLQLEGRFDEMRTLLSSEWQGLGRPVLLLRKEAMIDLEPMPAEWLAGRLEEAAAKAPDDARVWLARANLAIRTQHESEAKAWLDACLERDVNDPPVWLAMLDLAVVLGDRDLAAKSMKRLRAADIQPARVQRLRAWFAGLIANPAERIARERSEIGKLLEIDPGDSVALERLASLEIASGNDGRAAALRRRKRTLDDAKHTYRHILVQTVGSAGLEKRASELANLAEALGRRFEAEAWQDIAHKPKGAQGHPGDTQAKRSDTQSAQFANANSGLTLAEAVGSELMRAGASKGVDLPGGVPKRAWFRDIASASGLTFTYENGRSTIRQLPETSSGGVALLDYDGDGWLDVYLVQGGTFPPDPERPRNGDRLFRNNGDGTFADATAESGLAKFAGGYGHGVTVGDYDNDGRPDLFVTRWSSYALYHNRGDGTFEDMTEKAGLAGNRDWPSSAAWADFDNDGDLDLFVSHYAEWDPAKPKICRGGATGYSYCDPKLLKARSDHLFRNDKGHFVDVTTESGIIDREGRGLGVLAADIDDDGKIDIVVANDGSANFLFRNLGGMKFEEVAHAYGLAANAEGGYQAGMGIARGDIDGDGKLDLLVTNFYGESTTFFKNIGGGYHADESARIGLASATRYTLGFGIVSADFNNDGHSDVAIANGHVNDFRPLFPYEMPAQLLLGTGGKRLLDVSGRSGDCWKVPRVGRGLAAGDLDNDGRVDLVLVGQKQPVAYFHNESTAGNFITIGLVGTRSNRDAIGARLKIKAGKLRLVAERFGGGSYGSASDSRIHLGVANSRQVDAIEVHWPSGATETFGPLAVNRGWTLVEGSRTVEPMRGFKKE